MNLLRWFTPGHRPRTRSSSAAALLDVDAFQHAAMGERMRVDRNGSVLSMLLIRLPSDLRSGRIAETLAEALHERLRITDTVGQLRDGRWGVLLPDTPPSGARHVMRDIRGLIGDDDLDIDLQIYPEDGVDGEWDAGATEREPALPQPTAVTQSVAENAAVGPEGVVFVQPLPWWKRATDLVVASAALVVALPVIAVSAVAVAATSRGGAFFLQEREGLGGRRFRIYKIRTMRVDAEQQKQKLRRRSVQDGPAFKMRRDPRVTPVGRVLRALSLDELPQLINVLKGEMSLVGPRPLPVDESQQCEPWQRRRLLVTPGITCIWQVRGRNTVSFDEWVRMDLRYLRRRTPWGDLKLLIETVPSLITSKGPR